MQSFGVFGDGLAVLPASGGVRTPEFKLFSAITDVKSGFSGGIVKGFPSYCGPKLGIRLENCRGRSLMMRASGSSRGNTKPVAPLQFESPTGQFLSQLLQNHPHLLPAAIDQQLESLQTDRDAQEKEAPPPAQDLLLYRRIAEVKDKERQKALEEIIYCLTVHKFIDKDISMIPPITPAGDLGGTIDSWPNQEEKLETVHSSEAFEMIQSHLSLVLGDRFVGTLTSIVQISKLRLGKLYAASIMYGYFLKRVDQRFQLERSMKMLPAGFNEDQIIIEGSGVGPQLWESLIQISTDDEGLPDFDQPVSSESKANKLRSYVMYLDADTLQRYATIRSKEAISLIEKQTQALFGQPDVRIAEDGSLDTSNDEIVGITLSGLTTLVLEAVAFGSFLWGSEDYVESKYRFVSS